MLQPHFCLVNKVIETQPPSVGPGRSHCLQSFCSSWSAHTYLVAEFRISETIFREGEGRESAFAVMVNGVIWRFLLFRLQL